MSVNAVNAAEPQQKKGSPVGTAIAAGLGLGAVAGVPTYFIKNKRPDLDKVFAMPDDTFETATQNAEGEVKTNVDTIKEARKQYAEAGKDEYKELSKQQTVRGQNIDAFEPENKELKTNFEDANTKLKDKTVPIGDNDYKLEKVRSELKEAKNAVKKAAKGTDEAAKTAAAENLTKAQANYDAFKAGAKDEMKAYVDAQRKLNYGRIEAYNKAAAVDGSEAKQAQDALNAAKTKLREVRSNKLTELLGKEENKTAFEKIKHLFPKEGGTKAALIAGGIAAAVGLIAGYVMGGNKTEA